MSRVIMQQALDLLKSAHVSTALIWERHDCVNALEQELAKPEQEPQMIQIKDGQLSYIKKPWVGLTNEELVEIRETHQAHIFNLMFAVEAKIREKNDAV